MSVFSFPIGVNPDTLLRPDNQSDAAPSSPSPSKQPTPKFKRRTRDPEGQFKPDDPSTPQNEAWEESATEGEPA